MKRKFLPLTLAFLLTGSLFLSATGCGGNNGGGTSDVIVDPTKTQIYVSCYTGGFGSDWMAQAISNFNANHSEYQVIKLQDNKDDNGMIMSRMEAGTDKADVYVAGNDIYHMANKGLLMDLSDIYDDEVDGKPLQDKIDGLDDWANSLKYEGKWYGIPHNDELISAVVDYALLEKNGWLIYDEDGNVSVGRDGEAGTLDDGLPVTLDEWEEMVMNIAATDTLPFIYSGVYYFYCDHFMFNMLAQYLGEDSYMRYYDWNGNYVDPETKAVTAITPETGYKLFTADKGKLEVAQFAEEYLINKDYVHPSSFLSTDHMKAQSNFILGHHKAASNPQAAILFDGIWWENEARPTFMANENAKDYEYGFGVHDYRILPAPVLDNSVGYKGNTNATYLQSNGNNSIYARKTNDATKETGIKEFIKYLASDEISQIYAVQAGGVRPYDYSPSEADYQAMTPFTRSVYSLVEDRDNCKILRTQLLTYKHELNYMPVTTKASIYNYKAANGLTYNNFISGLRAGLTAQQIFDGASLYYTQSVWNGMLAELN